MKPPPTTEEILPTLNRPLPWSDDAERGVLSCALQWPHLLEECPPPDAFYHEANRQILSHLLALYGAGKPIDPISLTHALRETGNLDRCGGAAGVSELFCLAPISTHFAYYTGIVRQKYQLRAAIGALAAGLDSLLRFNESDGVSAADTIQAALKAANEAANDDGSPDLEFRPMPEILNAVMDAMEDRAKNPGKIPGISTGFPKLDEYSGGLERGTLTVIAAKPSEGKSALCRQIIESACLNDHACDLFTVEMTDAQEVTRLLCSQAAVDAQNMKLGLLTRGELASLQAKIPRIAKWNLRVIDSADLTIEKICRSVVKRAKALPKGTEYLVVVDYVQIVSTAENTPNREREVAHITKTAKQCAKATGARFVMPSQLNDMNEARESRSIEQDADNFWMIVDAEKEEQPKKAWQKKESDESSDEKDLFLKKTRNGMRRKRVPLRANMRHFRFEPRGENKA